jgi:hypothetical protein
MSVRPQCPAQTGKNESRAQVRPKQPPGQGPELAPKVDLGEAQEAYLDHHVVSRGAKPPDLSVDMLSRFEKMIALLREAIALLGNMLGQSTGHDCTPRHVLWVIAKTS